MTEFKASGKPRIAVLLDNRVEVTFTTTAGALKDLEQIKDKESIVTVKEFSKRRSLSQNAYLWVLLDQIGQKIGQSKEYVYRTYVKDYGTFEILPIKNEAVEMFKRRWGKNGLGWFCEDLGESKIDGYTKLVAYYGTSTYTKEEMKRVLDAVVQDCEEMGISAMSMADIMLLKNENG